MDSLLIGILSGLVSGFVSSYLIFRFIKNIVEGEYEEEEVGDDVIINIEFNNGLMYLYNKRTEEFVIQGSEWNPLYEQLVKKYPNKNILIENGQLERAKRFGSE